MSIWGAIAGGFVGTLVLTTGLRAACELGLTRMDLPFLLGTAFTADRARIKLAISRMVGQKQAGRMVDLGHSIALVEAQAIDRAHRIGQDRTVIAYRMLATGTIEEKIWELQQRKAALARDILGEGSFARTLTHGDLDYLLAET